MCSKTAHILGSKWRSSDIQIEEDVNFSGFLLSEKILYGLRSAGFVRPSPIQLQSIPLGKSGFDLIVQAKSGTGKTCVFAVIALEKLLLESRITQALVLAPTREVAVQICQVVRSIGAGFKGLQCHYFIGGMPLQQDKIKLQKCHIAVGTPGRIKQLIKQDLLKTKSIRLFVLDEADKLMEDSFQQCVNWIYSSLPVNKQMLALSATYPEDLAQLLQLYMTNPSVVRLNADKPALLGVKQFSSSTPYHPMQYACFQSKIEALIKVLNHVSFSQCLVFSNYQTRAESLCDLLKKYGWPTEYISGSQEQVQRLRSMDQLKLFKCRVLVSTDVSSRGIDAENVNLVINMDVPWEVETYFHRIGRAGRFGSKGIAISFVTGEEETKLFEQLKVKGHLQVSVLPDPLPADLWSYDFIQKEVKDSPNLKSYEIPLCESTSVEESDKHCLKNEKETNHSKEDNIEPHVLVNSQKSEIINDSSFELVGAFSSSVNIIKEDSSVKVNSDQEIENEETSLLLSLNSFLISNHEGFRLKMENEFEKCHVQEKDVKPFSKTDSNQRSLINIGETLSPEKSKKSENNLNLETILPTSTASASEINSSYSPICCSLTEKCMDSNNLYNGVINTKTIFPNTCIEKKIRERADVRTNDESLRKLPDKGQTGTVNVRNLDINGDSVISKSKKNKFGSKFSTGADNFCNPDDKDWETDSRSTDDLHENKSLQMSEKMSHTFDRKPLHHCNWCHEYIACCCTSANYQEHLSAWWNPNTRMTAIYEQYNHYMRYNMAWWSTNSSTKQ